MVYDCFQFFNELDILKLRLHIMDPIVDYFVISEATQTFSGMKKPLYYEENKEMFKEFEHKIIHIVVDDTPKELTYTHDRDNFQKDAVARGLKNCKDDDVIIFSDLDEIPNPETVKKLLPEIQPDKIYHMAQNLYYCYINMLEVSGSLLSCTGEFDGITEKKWLGTKIFTYGYYKNLGLGLNRYRFPERKEDGIRVADGGWHFGYMGGHGETDVKKRVREKVISAAHQEVNNKETLAKVKDQIDDGKDLFGREAEFIRTEIDDTYPEYLRSHLAEYEYLIKKPDTEEERIARKKREEQREKKAKMKRAIKNVIKKMIGRK